ncbi:MAG: glycosyl hydrolase 53 family protein [Ignavibacteriaceae bacterium]|nr:glycosyl hydrolase 53 family protein [Ignavibacteriaceae bacterium]
MLKSSNLTLQILLIFSGFLLPQQNQVFFYKGADVSFLSQTEWGGAVYKISGVPVDALAALKESGINTVRLRLWNNPQNGYSNMNDLLYLARRAKNLGLRLMLDFHFSDTWADPAHQTIPSAWQNISFSSLTDSVREFSGNTIMRLRSEGIIPDIVQPGNEISCGMLWNHGNVCGEYNNPLQWSRLVQLINASAEGIRSALAPGESVKIMIHSERSGDLPAAQWFFTNLINYGAQFDIIGLSYYPWWHGNPETLNSNMQSLAQNYDKELIITETAYPFTTAWYDTTHNIVGPSTPLLPDYPASVAGQKEFIENLIGITASLPGNKGKGVFYWAPEYISSPGFGSSWENLALFDFAGNILTSAYAFQYIPSSAEHESEFKNLPDFTLFQNYPNPFNPETHIKYTLQKPDFVSIKVYDVRGELKTVLQNSFLSAGNYSIHYNASELSSGIYFLVVQTSSSAKTIKMTLIR